MSRKILLLPLALITIFFLIETGFTQTAQNLQEKESKEAESLVTIKGVIIEIAKDGSYIIVDDNHNKTKFLTNKEYIDNAYFEINDNVEFIGEKTEQGLKLADYTYIFEGETPSYDYEGNNETENTSQQEGSTE